MKIPKLQWEQVSKECRSANPWLSTNETTLGKDPDGLLWKCRAKYMPDKKAFMVWFDNDTINSDEDKCDIPFLRHDVTYAENYWKAHRERYSTKFCDYDDVVKVIYQFIVDHKLDTVDTTYKRIC